MPKKAVINNHSDYADKDVDNIKVLLNPILKAIQQYKVVLLDLINKDSLKKPVQGRPCTHSNEYCFVQIMDIIRYALPWSFLDGKHSITGCAFKKIFYKWRDKGYFKKALKIVKLKVPQNNKDFIVDSSNIQNLNGIQDIGYCKHKCKGKKSKKIHVITNLDGIIIEKVVTKGGDHDVKSILPLIKKLEHNSITKRVFKKCKDQRPLIEKQLNNDKSKTATIKIYADKGYISLPLREELAIKNINYVYIQKKNAKRLIKLSKSVKTKSKKRFRIENTFSILKRSFKRFQLVHDKSRKTFNTTFDIAQSIITIYKLNNKMDKVKAINEKNNN